jgi:serine/threonine-protein kinase
VVDVVTQGTTLGGRYKLEDRIASGGMGDVWRGIDEVLGRTVAVKILLPALLDEPGFAERFRGEARSMATINHPGVVDVYDYGSDPAVGAYLVMEYVEGDALSQTLSRVGRLTPARTMALIAQAADALQAAHDKGIVHRDVKPGNLLVRPNGTLVLTDFGIARSAMVGQLTQVGSVLGTASYISPEQAAGGVASPQSDVYALGVVAYQCLAGRRPFEGDNPLEIAMKHVRSQPPPLPPDIPPAVRTVVDRAMAKDPAARFLTAAALGQVARRAAGGLSSGGTTQVSPAGAPISAPPVASQTSPGMVGATSTGNRPTGPVPGGTRRMPAYSTAPMNRPASAPTSPPGYGRAAPPAPPRRQDTGYLPPAQPAQRGRSNRLIIGIVIVLVVLLLLIGLVFALKNGGGDGSSGLSGPQNSTSSVAQPSLGAPPAVGGQSGNGVRTIDCADMQNKKADSVERSLRQQGFTNIHKARVSGGKSDTVQSVTPCQAGPNDPITMNVYTGKPVTPTGGATTGGCIDVPLLGGCPTSTGTGTPSGAASPSSTPKN